MDPSHRETTLLGASKISDGFVLSEKYWQEAAGVLFYFVFYAKVINYKEESDEVPFVCEQTTGVLGFMVSWGGKVLHEVIVGNNDGLGKAVQAL